MLNFIVKRDTELILVNKSHDNVSLVYSSLTLRSRHVPDFLNDLSDELGAFKILF